MKGIRSIGLLSVFLLAACSAASAQTLYGSITGNVRDASGAVVPGATVTITQKETNQTRQTTSNEAGLYTFTTVQTGTYALKVTKEGFKTFEDTAVPITLNNLTRLDVTLTVGAVAEAVTVTAEAPLLQSDTAEVKAEVGGRSLQELPTPIGRNYQQAFRALPGFTPPANAHSIPSNPSRALQYYSNGTSASGNNVRIDGASNYNIWLPHITAYVPALESIETVNVVSSSFDAEQGLAGGSAVNVQLRSGTNELHGSAFEFHNNNNTKARPFFLPRNQNKPKWVYNQFGGTIGGPIKRDKLFFFASYEAQFDRRFADGLYTVPTAAMRTGDLTASATRLFDPTTGAADGSGRTEFADKRIPTARLDPVALKFLSFVPAPTYSDRLVQNYYAALPFSFDRHTLDTKVNWNVTDKLRMWGRYSFLRFDMLSRQAFGDHGPELAGGNPGMGFGDTHSYTIAGSYVATPNLVIDAHFGYTLTGQNVEQPRLDEKIGLSVLGIPGTNGPRRFEGGWPRIRIDGFTTMGVPNAFMPYYRSDPQYQYVANAGWTKGKHNVRFGMDLYQQTMRHTQPEHYTETEPASGGFQFGRNITSTTGQTVGDYNSFGAFLLGAPSSLGRILQVPDVYRTDTWSLSFYARDQWQVTRKLTLSYGMRYEIFPIPTRGERGLERYDFATGKMLVCGVGNVPRNCGVEISKNDFAPRLGIAYRPSNRWVIRTGYGITNDPFNIARSLRTNHPLLLPFRQAGANAYTPAGSLRTGIPAIPVPDSSTGVVDIGGGIGVNTLAPGKFSRGYIQSWNFSVQRELGKGFVANAAYVGTRQIGLLGLLDSNYGQVGGGRASQALVIRFNRDAQTNVVTQVGNTHYDALQMTLERRFAGGYQLMSSWTWSKTIGIHNVQTSTDAPAIKIPQYYHLNRAVLGFSRTHNFNLSGIAELPFGRGKRWATSGPAAAVFGGWQLNAMLSLYSGLPHSVTASGASLNAPFNTQRADLVKSSVAQLGGIGSGNQFFDRTAFAPVTTARFGTAGFNLLRGPGLVNLDFGVFRNFNITERYRLQFRMESFNFTNTPHFANPNGDANSSSFSYVTGVANIGREGFDERIFRFALRLSF
jgi:hypothetical protein